MAGAPRLKSERGRSYTAMFSLLGGGQTPASRPLPYATPGTGGTLAPGDIWARFNDSGMPSISRAEAKELTERVALLERNVRARVLLCGAWAVAAAAFGWAEPWLRPAAG